MKVLITGIGGFIGQALEKHIAKTRPDWIIHGLGLGHVRERNYLNKVTSIIKQCSAVFHVGALSSTDIANVNEAMYYNYLISTELFDLCARFNCPMIFSSSASVYGDGDRVPKNLYAWTKRATEDYCMANRDGKFAGLRYFNVYGYDECHKGDMASVVYQAYRDNKGGKTFGLFRGNPTRDFVYIDDVVEANIKACDYLINERGPSNKYMFDVGTGVSVSFEALLDTGDLKYHHKNEAPPKWYQFATCANKHCFVPDWTPKFDYKSGVKAYLQVLKDNEF